MSMRASSLPRNASLIAEASGTIAVPERAHSGKKARARRYAALVSDGWKSGYQHHHAEYIVVEVEGQKTWAKRYSGKHLNNCDSQWKEIVAMLRKEEAHVSEAPTPV